MIAQINELSALDGICGGHVSELIKAYASAYGFGYDFCRFYAISDNNLAVGEVCILNSSMLVSFSDNAPLSAAAEAAELTVMLSPSEITVENGADMASRLVSDYSVSPLCHFDITAAHAFHSPDCLETNPQLDAVWRIASGAFDIADYSLWYTNSSHLRRHGVADFFVYKGASCLRALRTERNRVYFSDIATMDICRGRGYAEEMISAAVDIYRRKNNCCYLLSDTATASYYKKLGFTENEHGRYLGLSAAENGERE